MHREAKKAFDALGVKKLHSIKSLSKEYEQELAGKRKLYTEYQKVHTDMPDESSVCTILFPGGVHKRFEKTRSRMVYHAIWGLGEITPTSRIVSNDMLIVLASDFAAFNCSKRYILFAD